MLRQLLYGYNHETTTTPLPPAQNLRSTWIHAPSPAPITPGPTPAPVAPSPVTVKTGQFSDESSNNKGECPLAGGTDNNLPTAMIGLDCNGSYCDKLIMVCHNTGTMQLNAAVSSSGYFSDETDNGGLGVCPGSNEIVTGITCQGSYCDNLNLLCQELTSVTLDHNNCGETATIPSPVDQDPYGQIPNGAYSVGLRCSGSFCAYKTLRYCYPVGYESNAVQTREFSDETGNDQASCPTTNGIQFLMTGIICSGVKCDNLKLTCSWSDSPLVKDGVTISSRFSDENGGIGTCQSVNQVITGLKCEGQYCDNLYLYCQELQSVKIDYNNCGETSTIASDSSQIGYGEIPYGSYAVGIRCTDSFCWKKSLLYCYPEASSTGAGTLMTREFNYEDGNNRASCPVVNGLQATMIGLICDGKYCSNMAMTCYHSGYQQVKSYVSTSGRFSEESGGLGICPGINEVVTGIRCEDLYCDSLYLSCQELSSASLDYSKCAETFTIPSLLDQSGYGQVPGGSYPIGIRCSGDYCAFKAIRYCQAVAPAPTSPPTKHPTKSPTPNPTKPPTRPPTKSPTKSPTYAPTRIPTKPPTKSPTKLPTRSPIPPPTKQPTTSYGNGNGNNNRGGGNNRNGGNNNRNGGNNNNRNGGNNNRNGGNNNRNGGNNNRNGGNNNRNGGNNNRNGGNNNRNGGNNNRNGGNNNRNGGNNNRNGGNNNRNGGNNNRNGGNNNNRNGGNNNNRNGGNNNNRNGGNNNRNGGNNNRNGGNNNNRNGGNNNNRNGGNNNRNGGNNNRNGNRQNGGSGGGGNGRNNNSNRNSNNRNNGNNRNRNNN